GSRRRTGAPGARPAGEAGDRLHRLVPGPAPPCLQPCRHRRRGGTAVAGRRRRRQCAPAACAAAERRCRVRVHLDARQRRPPGDAAPRGRRGTADRGRAHRSQHPADLGRGGAADPHLPGPAVQRGRCPAVRALHALAARPGGYQRSGAHDRLPRPARRRVALAGRPAPAGPGDGAPVLLHGPLPPLPAACPGARHHRRAGPRPRPPAAGGGTAGRQRLGPSRRECRVLDTTGARAADPARLPRVAGRPAGNDPVPTGRRSIGWRNDAPATLVWVEAQDGGDPAVEAEVRDRVFSLAAPYTGEPQVLADLSKRYAGITWGDGELALVSERWWKDRSTRTWKIAPDAPGAEQELVFARSYADRSSDRGAPVTAVDENGRSRLVVAGNGEIFLQGAGASPEGDRPFLDRFDLETGESTRLFHSQAPHYESVQAMLDSEGRRLLTTRETPT